MYALRLAYQRHRRLAPWVVAMVALFFVTLITTMPVPPVEAVQSSSPVIAPATVEPIKAGQLATLLSHEGLEYAGDESLAFEPAARPF